MTHCTTLTFAGDWPDLEAEAHETVGEREVRVCRAETGTLFQIHANLPPERHAAMVILAMSAVSLGRFC